MAVLRNGDFQFAITQRWRQAEMAVPGAREHGLLLGEAVVDSGTEMSSIPESLCALFKLKLPGANIRVKRVLGMSIWRTVRWPLSSEGQYR